MGAKCNKKVIPSLCGWVSMPIRVYEQLQTSKAQKLEKDTLFGACATDAPPIDRKSIKK